jgi:hypothetical protein
MVHPRTEYNRRWREKNIERLRIQKAAYDKAHSFERKDEKVLSGIRERARKKGLEFNLTLEDVSEYSVCPVFGFELVRGEGKPQFNSPSVDRIDSSRGYTKDNVQILSQLANAMKQNATPEQLVAFAKWVLKTYEKESE